MLRFKYADKYTSIWINEAAINLLFPLHAFAFYLQVK